MKAPRTPSPKRCREDDDSLDSVSFHSSSHRLPDSSSAEEEWHEKSASRRSPLSVALIFVFCAGIIFFTSESIRYASKVGVTYPEIETESLVVTSSHNTGDTRSPVPVTPKVVSPTLSSSQGKQQHYHQHAKTMRNAKKGKKGVKAKTEATQTTNQVSSQQHTTKALPVRGLSDKQQTAIQRKLKGGRGRGRRRRGMGGMGGGGRTNLRNDLLYLNGGLTPRASPNVETTPQLQRIMTNVQIFQPGIGFLPQGANIILAPGPRRRRRRGMGMGGGRGMGMGMGMGSSRSRDSERTPRPTAVPTRRPTPVPTEGNDPSASPSRTPSRSPSSSPSSSPSVQPSLSKAPSRSPSSIPSSQPSLSANPT
ncbi:expressed unknown protein [Seminavis robusta]|uniref:Transmembrane protein n=1 Tax=Seminavis robusta TaxID=568900 RepID=A0A9N8H5C9_9STRA|nr:expressed unknown protein [Seminavis robusta]|eukprot:Sro139_g065280.1 n/a (365) ;mRNA; r:105331-106425